MHLTLTSEWKEYRWGPLSGKKNTPGMVDSEGDMWPTVAEVVKHATADEVDDLHNYSYDWIIPADVAEDDKKLDEFKMAKYIDDPPGGEICLS